MKETGERWGGRGSCDSFCSIYFEANGGFGVVGMGDWCDEGEGEMYDLISRYRGKSHPRWRYSLRFHWMGFLFLRFVAELTWMDVENEEGSREEEMIWRVIDLRKNLNATTYSSLWPR